MVFANGEPQVCPCQCGKLAETTPALRALLYVARLAVELDTPPAMWTPDEATGAELVARYLQGIPELEARCPCGAHLTLAPLLVTHDREPCAAFLAGPLELLELLEDAQVGR